MNSIRRSHVALLDTLPLIFGILSTAIAIVALAGWAIGQTTLASFGQHLIPMAPSTAALLVLLGSVLVLRNRMPKSRSAIAFGVFFSLAAGGAGVILMWSSFLNVHPTIEYLGLTIAQPAVGTLIGHMSPASAAGIVACAATSLLIVKPSTARSKRAVLAFVLSSVLVLASMLLAVGYLYASPLMYDGEFIPMALPTALAVLSLALGLQITSASQVWPPSEAVNEVATRGAYVLLLVFLFFASGILAGGYFTYRSFEQNFQTGVEAQLSSIAALKMDELVDFRNDWLGEASLLSQNAAFSSLVRRSFGSPGDDEALANLRGWLGRYQSQLRYDLVCVIDARGAVRISQTAERNWTDVFLVERATGELHSDGPSIVDFYRDEHDQRVYLAVLVPIKSDRVPGRSLGVVALRIDPHEYLFPFIKSWPTSSKSSESLILRREGDHAVFLNDLRFQDSTALNFRTHISNDRMLAVQAAVGIVGIVEGLDYRGHEVIGDVGPVPGSPWFQVVRTDKAEAYEPLRERLWLIIVLVGVLLLGVGAGVSLVWRHQRSSYFQEQLGLQHTLASSEAQYREVFESSLDAIILATPDGSILSANTAARGMFQRSEEDLMLVGRSGIVDASDPRLEEMLSSRRREGRTRGEMTLMRKDGSRFPAEISMSLFQDGEGRSRASMFIRDVTERKQAEEALSTSQRVIEGIINVIPVRIFWKDKDLVYLGCNAVFARDAGFVDPKDVIGKDDFRMGWRDQAELYRGDDRQVMESGSSRLLLEEPQTTPEGKTITLLTSKVPLRNSMGDVIGVVGTYMDITESKQSELQVRESEKRFKAIFDQAPIALTLVDTQGHLNMSNEPLSRMVGYSKEELSGLTFSDFTHPDDVEVDLDQFHALIAGKTNSYSIQKRYIHKNGNVVWANLHVTGLRDEHGTTQEIIGMAQDITERKLAEDALSKSEERFRALAENSSDIISVIAMDGMIRYESPSIEHLLGYKPEEWIGTSAFNWMHPDDRSRVAELLSQAIQKPVGGASAEFRLRHADGSWRDFEAVGRSYLDEDGQRAGLINSRDITERKRSESLVNEQIKELQRWHNATIGRETRVLELKREVNELLGKTNQPARYASTQTPMSGLEEQDRTSETEK